MQKSRRMDRMNALLQKEVAEILRKELSDPRVQWVTIVDVQVSADMSNASVYVSSLQREEGALAQSVDALTRAAGFIRRELGKRIETRTLPQLRFFAAKEQPGWPAPDLNQGLGSEP
jgi:ribosome-binding factor A